jgi:hypothetical protein
MMSALLDEDDDNAAEKLRRAGIATDRTIFTAPANGTRGADQVRRVLFPSAARLRPGHQ